MMADRLLDGWTDYWTDGRTDRAKTICLPQVGGVGGVGDIIKKVIKMFLRMNY